MTAGALHAGCRNVALEPRPRVTATSALGDSFTAGPAEPGRGAGPTASRPALRARQPGARLPQPRAWGRDQRRGARPGPPGDRARARPGDGGLRGQRRARLRPPRRRRATPAASTAILERLRATLPERGACSPRPTPERWRLPRAAPAHARPGEQGDAALQRGHPGGRRRATRCRCLEVAAHPGLRRARRTSRADGLHPSAERPRARGRGVRRALATTSASEIRPGGRWHDRPLRAGLRRPRGRASASTTSGRTITESDLVSFAALTGDWHPQHADAAWAAASRFGERVAHGMLVLSYAVGLLPFDPERVVALRAARGRRLQAPGRRSATRSTCEGARRPAARRSTTSTALVDMPLAGRQPATAQLVAAGDASTRCGAARDSAPRRS